MQPMSATRRMVVGATGTLMALASWVDGAAGAPLRVPAGEVARLDVLYAAATPGSPAQFRLHEERDRLALRTRLGS
jgi:hypothetical protein